MLSLAKVLIGFVSGCMLMALTVSSPVMASTTQPSQPPAFRQCLACHSVDAGKTNFGPNLRSVVGRKAASLPGYNYSPALKKAQHVWDVKMLDRWLTSPAKMVPGTRMPFGGVPDKKARAAVIAYLATLK
jgi:cytochrome c